MSIQLFVVSLFPLFGLFQFVLWNSERRQTASKGKILKSVCVACIPRFHNPDELTGFLTCFPFFGVFPSALEPIVTLAKKVDETHSSGSCTGFAPVSLTDFLNGKSSSNHLGKNTKNIQRGDVHNFFRKESVHDVKKSKFAQK